MTLEEVTERMANVIADLQGEPYGNIMVQVASDALFLIKDRVINRGEDPDEKKLKPYSSNPMLTTKSQMSTAAYNKIAGSKQKKKELTWVVKNGQIYFVLPYGYSQFRKLHGRQTRHVDYTFSGRMWNNIKLQRDRSNLNGGVAVIGASTPEEKAKIENLIELRGVFLKPSKRDMEVITQTFNTGIMNIFKKNGISV